jgi:IS30 family transposase
LVQAVHERRPVKGMGLVHHSDRGSQYPSIRYTERLADVGIDTSVGSVGDSYDNALAESIIGLFKTEVINFLGPWKSMAQVVWESGGMPPSNLAPSAPSPSRRYLCLEEREQIALLLAQNVHLREIARRLGRAASTSSREIRRNAATRSGGFDYRATTAQWHAERSAERPKAAKLATNAPLRQYVQDRLSGQILHPDGSVVVGPQTAWNGRRHGRRQPRRWANAWSPEQISSRLRIDFPGDETMRISHEAIYQSLFIQGRGALRRELTACLRTGRALRVPRARTAGRGKSFVTSEIMISERPAEAADRAVPGHWEGDLIIGLNRSGTGTLVERQTRFTLLLHLPRMPGYGEGPRVKNGPALAGHGAEAVRDAILRSIVYLPQHLRRSLSWDQGAEMARHAELTVAADLPV